MAVPNTVLIVEDDALIQLSLKMMCTDLGFDVIGVAGDAAAADQLLQAERPDYILMDVRLGGSRDGVDIANSHRENLLQSKVIYLTGSSEKETIDRINDSHPYKILFKPVDMADLRSAIS